jgi:DegV family protein with EDD domain
MTHKIALVTDSTCDIPMDWLEKYEITVVPMTVIFGDEPFLDGRDITPVEFYEKLLTDPRHPTTSQPSPADFVEAYKKATAGGAEEVLAIIISSAMSGTYASAVQAVEMFDKPVHVVDSRSNSMGLGWQVIAAARARESGGDLKAMLDAASHVRGKVAYYIALDTIEYLAKGGRIGGAVKFMNSVLKIKPLVYVNHETGTVGAGIPSGSRVGVLKNMYKEFFKHVDTTRPLHITVLHNHSEEDAQRIEDQVGEEFSPVEIFTTIVTPILGAHTGPRAVALCGYSE